MSEMTLAQVFETCQINKSTWLTRKSELAEAEREYQEIFVAENESGSPSLQMLRDIIDVNKCEVNQSAGRYIRSHEDMQRISIRNRLDDFMVSHGAELAAALAPELMGYNGQHSAVKQRVMQHSVEYLREALMVWLDRGEKINYSAQDSELLTAAGFRPDAASRADNREKYTPVQNQNYVNKRAELTAR
ncbi:Polarity suppression protein [Leclercia adecarboxylata]|uniref:phage polarity suppression protein n=1 Tax=Leclercia adecarboxylata TaxID=83655 RepID=UPI002DBE20D0|nr:phage polarity suppression protein [Leclercia adecarboxylata]MEB6380632.1 Polarity suppression protein [Leclercia adecarboxylata]